MTSAKAREAERAQGTADESMRVAVWMRNHPGSTLQTAADGLDLPRYRVGLLMPQARTHFDGYLIPPAKPGRERFTDAAMFASLRACAKGLSLRKAQALSQGQYTQWRLALPDTGPTPKARSKATSPSALAYRRRYGTWTNAVKSAGMVAHEPPRAYDGLEVQDIVLWLALWLRDLTKAQGGLIDASQRHYRLWLTSNPKAPCEEIITMRGTWATLLAAASELEKTSKKLPKPKPVGSGARIKQSRR